MLSILTKRAHVGTYGTQYAQHLVFAEWELIGGRGKTHEIYMDHDMNHVRIYSRRLMGSTDQADPSCIYFRIS